MSIVKDLLIKKTEDIEFYFHGPEVEVKDRIFNFHVKIIITQVKSFKYPI